MPFQPEKIERSHVLKAFQDIDTEKLGIRPSTKWDIVYQGKRYPPKDVGRLAHEYATGEYFWQPGGGEGTNKYFKKLGFLVINKTEPIDEVIKTLIPKYKHIITTHDKYNEVYKWEAVENFQKHWDMEANDLVSMIDKSFPGNNNLWTSRNYYPINMLKTFAENNSPKVRDALKNLFNENSSLDERISAYQNVLDELLSEDNVIRKASNKHHYHDARSISLLLSFQAPAKYFLFKHGVLKKFCARLEIDMPKTGDIVNQILINNEVNLLVKEILVQDKELLEIHKNRLTPNSFKNDDYNILTQDFIYTVSTYMEKTKSTTQYWGLGFNTNYDRLEKFKKQNFWQAIDYEPGNKTPAAIKTRKAFEKIQVGDKVLIKGYGGTHHLKVHYKGEVVKVDKEKERLDLKPLDGDLFHGEAPRGNGAGQWRETIVPIKRMKDIDLLFYSKPQNSSAMVKNPPYRNHSLNQILYGPPGTGKTYKLREKYFERFSISESSISKEQFIINQVADLTWWQTFAIALYDLGKTSVNVLLGHEIVKAKASLSSAMNIRPIAWSRMQAHAVPECPNVGVVDRSEPSLFFKEADSEWYVVKDKVESLYPEGIKLLEEIRDFKPNEDTVIKNFEFVTFHQSFGYEDFVEGIKPKLEEGNSALEYEIKDGIFKKLCQRALQDPENNYAIFIDEINRGNVSAIFGELITLIEDDKRIGQAQELKLKLPYSKTEFGVPCNLHIIGTMNTADRSVEALDTALRRRFVFEEVMPDPSLLSAITYNRFNLKQVLTTINDRIEALLDRDHTIGHSYFIKLESGDTKGLTNVFKNNIIPLLQEYFYNDYEKIALVLGPGFVKEKETKKNIFPEFKHIEEPEMDRAYELIASIDDIEEAVGQLLGISHE